MKTLKKITLALFIAISMGAFSSAVMAGGIDARTVYSAGEALKLIDEKIQLAIEGINKGASPEEAASLIKNAQDATKELNSEANGAAIQRANTKLRVARGHAKEGALQEAEQEMKEAKKMFDDMKKYI